MTQRHGKLSARVGPGGTVLSLIARPLTVPVLRAHADGSLQLPDLGERIAGATRTTLRGKVENLRGIGALEREVVGGMPYEVENQLTAAGQAILDVAVAVEAWLAQAPQGPIALGTGEAKEVILALVGGWSSHILHALAAQPRSLTALSSAIDALSYPALERRLSAMRATRLVEPAVVERRGAKSYALTEWARGAAIPLLAAGRCESAHLAEQTISLLTEIDLESIRFLAEPLVELEG